MLGLVLVLVWFGSDHFEVILVTCLELFTKLQLLIVYYYSIYHLHGITTYLYLVLVRSGRCCYKHTTTDTGTHKLPLTYTDTDTGTGTGTGTGTYLSANLHIGPPD